MRPNSDRRATRVGQARVPTARAAIAALVAAAALAPAPASGESSIDRLRLALDLRMLTYAGDATQVMFEQRLELGTAGVFHSRRVLQFAATGNLGVVEYAVGGKGYQLTYGYDAAANLLGGYKLQIDLFASRYDSRFSAEDGPDIGVTTNLYGANVRVLVPRAPRLYLTYLHRDETFREEGADGTESLGRSSDELSGYADYQLGGTTLTLGGKFGATRDTAGTRTMGYDLFFRGSTPLRQGWTLTLDMRQASMVVDSAGATSTVSGPMSSFGAQATTSHVLGRFVTTGGYMYSYASGGGVEHMTNGVQAYSVFRYRPNLQFTGGLQVGREEALDVDPANDVGLTRLSGSLGVNASARNPYLQFSGGYSYGLGANWVEGDKAGLTQMHFGTASLTTLKLRLVRLDGQADVLYTTDDSALGETTTAYSAQVTADAVGLAFMKLLGILQFRHYEGIDTLRLRGRVSFTGLTGTVSASKSIDALTLGTNLYAHWFTQNSQGYAWATGASAFASWSAFKGRLQLASTLAAQMDKTDSRETQSWLLGNVRVSYATGKSRMDLGYNLYLRTGSSPHHSLLLSYRRWFDLL